MWQLLSGATTLCRTTNGFDNASRLAMVGDGTNSAAYSYLANSSLVGQIVFKSNTVTRMTTSKQYDFLNRLEFHCPRRRPIRSLTNTMRPTSGR